MIRVVQKTLRGRSSHLGRVCFFSTPTDGGDDQDKDKAKGKDAMKDYINRAKSGSTSQGIWGQLNAELGSLDPQPEATSRMSDNNSNSGDSDSRPRGEVKKVGVGAGRTVNNRVVRKQGKGAVNAAAGRGAGGGGGGVKTGADSDDEGGSFKSKRGKNKGDGKNDYEDRMDSYEEQDEQIPPEIQNQLMDHEFFLKLFREGELPRDTSHHTEFDPIDQLLYCAWIESFKSPTHSFKTILDTNERRRVQIKKARSMHDLLHYTQPRIFGAPKGSVAYEIAEDAWSVLHQNNYWTERQKVELVNGIASMGHQIWTEAEEMCKTTNYEDVDLIFQRGFKKGNEYLEREKEAAALAGLTKKDVNEFVQEETNWEEEAVEDEDQL